MGLSNASKNTLTVQEFRHALSRLPNFTAADARSLGVTATEADQIAPILDDALREYVTARLSDMGIAGEWRALQRLKRMARNAPQRLTVDERQRLLIAGKKPPTQARHAGDMHIRALIEAVLVCASVAGIAPTGRKDGGDSPAARFASRLLRHYAAKLEAAARGAIPAAALRQVVGRLRVEPSAIAERIASLGLHGG